MIGSSIIAILIIIIIEITVVLLPDFFSWKHVSSPVVSLVYFDSIVMVARQQQGQAEGHRGDPPEASGTFR